MRFECRGIPVSDGIAIAQVVVLRPVEITPDPAEIAPDGAEAELSRFSEALAAAKEQIEALAESAAERLGEQQAEIFRAHLSVLEDPVLEETIQNKITQERHNAPYAIAEGIKEIAALFQQLRDPYLQERAADIRDVGRRILENATGAARVELSCLPEDCIVAARDLTPSETVSMDFAHTLGFVTELGGRTSHTAIISRSMEIPAVVGAAGVLEGISGGETVILDALDGRVVVDPTAEETACYEQKRRDFLRRREALAALRDLPAQTRDGKRFELCANTGGPGDLAGAVKYGAQGVGLYRTEFLYMNNTHFPSEEEQFAAYREVAAEMGAQRPVIVRTLDIGGDKDLPYYAFEREDNPFLGWRAIRMCLDRTDLFKTQLRAILRAGVFGKLRIMFPMIISLEELLSAREILEECRKELRAEGVPFQEDIEVGIMVETPAAVMMADVLAAHVDFFSIGTNDLTQYTLAVDRGNPRIADRYDPLHPAVLRSIKRVIDASHAAGKWTGVCGELAGDLRAAALLAGIGLDEFSMTASSIPSVKKQLRDLDFSDARALAERALAAATADEVRRIAGPRGHI